MLNLYSNPLDLRAKQLSGPIPPELGNLTQLQVLSLGGNQLSGPIPSELGAFQQLQVLYLQDNQLSGPILPELGVPAVTEMGSYMRHFDGGTCQRVVSK